jgi:hypothetical protein
MLVLVLKFNFCETFDFSLFLIINKKNKLKKNVIYELKNSKKLLFF